VRVVSFTCGRFCRAPSAFSRSVIRRPDPSRFTLARVCFNDDVRLLRALGYDSLPDQRVPNLV
jgi:hypothetical protein